MLLLTLLSHLLSLLITSLLTGFMISRRNVPGFQRMGGVFFGMAGYSVAFLFKTSAPLLWEKIFWETIESAWLVQISISLLLFVVDYIELKIANPMRLYGSLLVLPAIISILLLTNDFKGGFRPDAVVIPSGPWMQLSYPTQLADGLALAYLKWNGSGYPRGLKGEEIPLAARIFSVVNRWDALTSSRVYRPEALSAEKTRAHILARTGSEFDPAVVETFIRLLDEQEHQITL